MKKIRCLAKVGALAKVKKSAQVFCGVVFLLLVCGKVSYSAGYKINERTKIYTQEISTDSVTLNFNNHFEVPVSVRVLIELDNLDYTIGPEIFVVIPAAAKGFVLAKFRKLDNLKAYKCAYKWKIVLGDVTKTPDRSFVYSYPYLKGNIYKISQGPGGIFSHKDMYAYDFLMPVGTPVVAARDGVVAVVKADSDIGGADRKYIEDANFISIYHLDGTLANYIHLSKDGVVVKEGQSVKKGELIGYSGNTGFSSGPHLHFEVIQPALDLDKNKWISFNWDIKPAGILSLVYRHKFIYQLFGRLNKEKV